MYSSILTGNCYYAHAFQDAQRNSISVSRPKLHGQKLFKLDGQQREPFLDPVLCSEIFLCSVLLPEYYPSGLKIQFCGGLMGFISYKQLGVSSETEAAKQYPPGHFITVYVTWIDAKLQRIQLALQKAGIKNLTVPEAATNQMPGIELKPCTGGKLWPGDLVNGRFQKVGKQSNLLMGIYFVWESIFKSIFKIIRASLVIFVY